MCMYIMQAASCKHTFWPNPLDTDLCLQLLFPSGLDFSGTLYKKANRTRAILAQRVSH